MDISVQSTDWTTNGEATQENKSKVDDTRYKQHGPEKHRGLVCKRFEPVHAEKTNNLGFRPGPTQTGLYSHKRWLEA